ncbi:adenylate kinase family protein [Halomicrococcus sp. NG-SE-24]|uniref:adenylate kinase family protein n=1 Tax=Halomicrococcus sp. NG-SE-24 TaxID=3436928 RepID=UPI003D971417
MKVAVTGTPGTGKTTATDIVASNLGDAAIDVVHLNEVVREEGFHEGEDAERGSLVADLDALADWLDDRERESEADHLLVESHLAHRFDADRVVVLRCRPEQLAERLADRGEPEAKATENAESEALDVVLSEAVAEHGADAVYEIDTTDRDPEAVADDVEAVVRGDRAPSAGEVEFTDYL